MFTLSGEGERERERARERKEDKEEPRCYQGISAVQASVRFGDGGHVKVISDTFNTVIPISQGSSQTMNICFT